MSHKKDAMLMSEGSDLQCRANIMMTLERFVHTRHHVIVDDSEIASH